MEAQISHEMARLMAKQKKIRKDTSKDEKFGKLVEKSYSSPHKVLLFGSSIIRNLGDVLRGTVYGNLGVGGDGVSDTFRRLNATPFEEKDRPHLQAILLHTGSNDASHCIHPQTVVDGILGCCDYIIKTNKSLTVVVSSLLPRVKSREIYSDCSLVGVNDENQMIKAINDALRTQLSGTQFLFMQNWKTLHHDYYSKDGVHLNCAGNAKLASNINHISATIFFNSFDGASCSRDSERDDGSGAGALVQTGAAAVVEGCYWGTATMKLKCPSTRKAKKWK